MPQFDTFSFFSQLFWVFLGFMLLFFLICFYLLPSIATILKIRKRKLAQISNNSNVSDLVTDYNFNFSAKTLLDNYYGKIVYLFAAELNNSKINVITKDLNILLLKYETKRSFNLTFYDKAQITTILYI